MTEPEANGMAADEWESRRLCSDENCIGVVGPDGRCKECGRPGEPGGVNEVPAEAAGPAAEPADPAPAPDESGRPADEWESRRLCSDGNCIGVVGPDGRCKECGKPYAG